MLEPAFAICGFLLWYLEPIIIFGTDEVSALAAEVIALLP